MKWKAGLIQRIWRSRIVIWINITNINPNNYSGSSDSLNQSSFPFQICDMSLPQDQTGSVYFLMSQKYTSYFHIGSTLCLRTTQRKYNAGGYVSGTNIAIHLRPFFFIASIFDFRKYRQIIEYTKDQWIDQYHHNVLQ